MATGFGARPDHPTPVVVIRPEQRSIEDAFLEREATLSPIARARISTRQEGFIRRRLVDEGDLIRRGDLIAELDDTDRLLRLAELRASLRSAEATRDEQERGWKRAEKLYKQKVISVGELEDQQAALNRARAEVGEARARVKLAEQALEELRIVAPMDSLVATRFTEQGEYLERGDPVVELKRVDTIIAVCTVSERHLKDVRQGAPAIVHVTAFPEQSFPGLVWKVIPQAQLESRSFPVWVLLPNPGYKLKLGMSARVSFVRSLEQALLVPKDAVLEDTDGSYVFVVSDGQVERRALELGPAVADTWNVRSGLSPEDLVVIMGNEDLETGEMVQIVELPPPGPHTLPSSLEAAHDEISGS